MSNCWTWRPGRIQGVIDSSELASLRGYVSGLLAIVDRHLDGAHLESGFATTAQDGFVGDCRVHALVQLGCGPDESGTVPRESERDCLLGARQALSGMSDTLRDATDVVELHNQLEVAAWQRGMDDLCTALLAMHGRASSEVLVGRTVAWLNDIAHGLHLLVTRPFGDPADQLPSSFENQ